MDSIIHAHPSSWRTRSDIRRHIESGLRLKADLVQKSYRVAPAEWDKSLIALCNWVYSTRSVISGLDDVLYCHFGSDDDIASIWRLQYLREQTPVDVISMFMDKIDQIVHIGEKQKRQWLKGTRPHPHVSPNTTGHERERAGYSQFF